MRNAMLPPAGENEMYTALLDGLRAAEKSRASSVSRTWESILETSRETVRPPRAGK